MIVFHIPGYLRQFTSGGPRVEITTTPGTVGEALAALWTVHPGVRDRVVDDRGNVRPHVNVFVGEESIRFTGGLSTPLGDGAEISIIPAVSGGKDRGDGPPSAERLAEALSAAGFAHHEYERVALAGVRDEQWAAFYAAFILGRLGAFAAPSAVAAWLAEAPSSSEWASSAAAYVLERLKERTDG